MKRAIWKIMPHMGEADVVEEAPGWVKLRFDSFMDYFDETDGHTLFMSDVEFLDTPTKGKTLATYTLTYEEPVIKDAVDHPDHYNNGNIECIEYLKDNMSWQGFTGYLEGNCKKYLHRWRYKQKPVEDLKKARWYLDRLISELEEEGN
jgi:hypothetical protein